MSKRLTYGTNQGTATPESAWRKRKDAWEHLGYVLSEISSDYQEEERRTEHELEAGRLMGLLAAIEPYWANPGIEYFIEVSRLMSGGQYEDAMKLVYQANQTFRNQTQYVDMDGHEGAEADPAQLGNVAPGHGKAQVPMVEILLVDNGPAEEIERFKDESTLR